MTQPAEQPLSQVTPLLVAALVCDAGVADPSTGKKNLVGIFDRLNVRTFPTVRSLSLYFKITDAKGRYDFDVRYVRAETNETLADAKGDIVISDRLDSRDFIIHFVQHQLPVPAEGRYEFQIWANSNFLGSAYINAVSRSKGGGSG